MVGYLGHLLDRAAGRGPVVRPRPRSRFEPLLGERDGWVFEAAADVSVTSSHPAPAAQRSTTTLEVPQPVGAVAISSASSARPDPNPRPTEPTEPNAISWQIDAASESPDPRPLDAGLGDTVSAAPPPAPPPPERRRTTRSVGRKPQETIDVGETPAAPDLQRRSTISPELSTEPHGEGQTSSAAIDLGTTYPTADSTLGDGLGVPAAPAPSPRRTLRRSPEPTASTPPGAVKAHEASRPSHAPVPAVVGSFSAGTDRDAAVAIEAVTGTVASATSHSPQDADPVPHLAAPDTVRSATADRRRWRDYTHASGDDDAPAARLADRRSAATDQSAALPAPVVRAREPDPPPVVNVTIGRVEVRQPSAPPPPAQPLPAPGPRPMSLTEYLDRRNARP